MSHLGGVITAMVTPFDADLRVDEEAAVRLLHHLADHGSDGVVICGTTGEAPTMSDEEQLALFRLAREEMGDRLTLVAGAGANDTRHAVELAERFTEAGADALLSVTPYYNRPNRRGIVAHFRAVAEATDRPIILYNIPSRTGTDMPNDLLAELAQIEHVDAVKQARTTDIAPIDGLVLLAGNDDKLREVLDAGGPGGILVASHLWGEPMRRMIDEPDRRAEIDEGLQDVWEAMTVTSNPIPIKAALNMAGIRVGGHRLPLVEADEQECSAIRPVLERHGLLRVAAT